MHKSAWLIPCWQVASYEQFFGHFKNTECLCEMHMNVYVCFSRQPPCSFTQHFLPVGVADNRCVFTCVILCVYKGVDGPVEQVNHMTGA